MSSADEYVDEIFGDSERERWESEQASLDAASEDHLDAEFSHFFEGWDE